MARRKLPAFRDRLSLGSGLQVSPFCMGQADQPSHIEAAYEHGINFFFVAADLHWPRYEMSRKGLASLFRKKGVRDDVVVCAASYVSQPKFCWAPFEELLGAIPGLARVDVVCAGGAYPDNLAQRVGVYREFRRHSAFGNAAIAASFHDRELARRMAGERTFDAQFIRFNPAHPGARSDYFPHLPRRRPLNFGFKSMSGYVPAALLKEVGLSDDQWAPEPTDFYRYALSDSKLDGLLIAPSAPREFRMLGEALARGPLRAAEQRYLEQLCALVLRGPGAG